MKRRTLLQFAAGSAAIAALTGLARATAPLKELRLDYAYYSPVSLVLRRFGWLEQEFKADGTQIKWVLSAGSNRALEYLNADSIDIGSSAGLAALLAKANGNPIRTPYIFSRPEWTALVRSEERRVGKECRSRCDWSSDVCSSDLRHRFERRPGCAAGQGQRQSYPHAVYFFAPGMDRAGGAQGQSDPHAGRFKGQEDRRHQGHRSLSVHAARLEDGGIEAQRYRAYRLAARRWPRRAGTGQGRCMGGTRSAHGGQRTGSRLAAAVPERGVQYLRLPERARGIPGAASRRSGARDPLLRKGARLDHRQSERGGQNIVR